MATPQPAATPAQLAKAALRRLATERLEPTPDNYLKAYHAESGLPLPAPAANAASTPEEPGNAGTDGKAWVDLVAGLVRGLERSTKQWTTARRKDSVQRVLDGSRSHPERLQRRLGQLVSSWEGEAADTRVSDSEDAPEGFDTDMAALMAADGSALPDDGAPAAPERLDQTLSLESAGTGEQAAARGRIVELLEATVQVALPNEDAQAREVAASLGKLAGEAVAPDGAHPPFAELIESFAQTCEQAQQVLRHRHHLLDLLAGLSHELTDSLSDLTEDDSWVRGQADVMRAQFDDGLNARGVRHVSQLLFETRLRQQKLRGERDEARRSLKTLLHQMLQEIAELGGHTDRFQSHLGRYAETIGRADSLESLAGAVREMVEESRSVQTLVSQTQQRLQTEHARASELGERVRELEDEIRKLSDEVSTDPLTQIANRRGLARAFEVERARTDRAGGTLAIGLLDIDNFKRLNDQLGHQTGDDALKFLTAQIQKALRPSDTLARYGGEEFVVLLPETTLEDAQAALTRLQRQVSAELFLANGEQQVFITFSAGVTLHRIDEPIEATLDRADVALYEAKRTGKNRTCTA